MKGPTSLSTMKQPASYLHTILKRLALPCLVFLLSLSLSLSKALYIEAFSSYGSAFYKVLPIGLDLSVWLSGAYFIDQSLRVVFFDGFLQHTLGRSVPDILKSILSIIISFAALVGILRIVFNFEIAGIWTTSGVAGIVLGIAVRPLIADVFSGLASNLEGAFHLGEWVTLDPGKAANQYYAGWVEEIRWRTTRLRNREGNICIIPNSMIATSIITNHALPLPWHRFSLTIILDTTIETARACRILEAALLSAASDHEGPMRLPGSEAKVTKIDEMGVHYALLFWGDPSRHSPYVLNDRVLKSVYAHLSKAGITVSQYRKQFVVQKNFEAETLEAKASQFRFLKNLNLFNTLKTEDLEFIAEAMIPHHYPKGHILVQAGDQGDSMFILAEGLLEVEGKLADGSPLRLGQINPGDCFGEMSLLTGAPRSAKVFTLVDSIVYEISKPIIKPILEKEPSVLEGLSKLLAERQTRNTHTQANSQKDASVDIDGHPHHILDRIKHFFSL